MTGASSFRNMGVDERQRRLCALQSHMAGCRLCVDAGHIPTALPIFHGNARAHVMIVGQAPAAPVLERPLPYSGATGKTLKSWLKRAGFDPETFYTGFYLTALTKCFPGSKPGSKGDRAPSRQEIELCRAHLEQELTLVRPALVIPLGRLSISYFVGSAPLSQVIGRVFERDGAIVLPLPHPSGVSHWLNAAEHRSLLDDALDQLSELRLRLDL